MACTPEPIGVFYFMKNINARIWFDLIDYEGYYLISICGEFMNLKTGRILKQEICKGYRRVTLSKNGIIKRYLSHRIIAFNFIKNIHNKKYVNHKDGNKLNNKIHNLEWVTCSENELHSYRKLNKMNSQAKIAINLQNGIFYDSVTKAAHSLNIRPGTLLCKLNGQNKNNTNIIYA